MKWQIVAINFIVLVNSIAAIARNHEKIIKKPLGLKPTKSPKTIIDEFRNLSPADVEFLKQVDKQFKVHGDKIKIKVERENSTAVTNKNTKRTIDSSLGYGHQQNQHDDGYYFSQPHLMHQFTLQDVPEARSGYREKATDIEIQQSQSFELKEDYQPDYRHSARQNYQQEQVYEDPVPVIVLRIPGPQKYALHLQALLQQYLEIRATQYIKALEEQERHGHLMHPQHYVSHAHQQMQYIPMIAITPMYHQQYYQQQQVPQYYQQTDSYQIPAGEQSYYHQSPTLQPQQEFIHAPKHQQQEFPTSYINFVTPAYEEGVLHHRQQHQANEELETVENYPSDKHTQVIFKKKKNRVHRPHHQTKPIVVAESPVHQHHQEVVYEHQPEPSHHNHEPEHDYSNHHNEYQAPADVVAVTQRSKSPINYHVQSTLAPTHEEWNERHNPKRMAPFTKEQFEKARRIMMNKSKKNRAAMREKKEMHAEKE